MDVATSGQNNGLNVIKVSYDGSVCHIYSIAKGLNTYVNAYQASTDFITAMNSIQDGEVAVVSVTDTANALSASAIASLQSTLGATVTSFPYRYSYVIIGRKPGIKLCEQLPSNRLLTCSIDLYFTTNPSTSGNFITVYIFI